MLRHKDTRWVGVFVYVHVPTGVRVYVLQISRMKEMLAQMQAQLESNKTQVNGLGNLWAQPIIPQETRLAYQKSEK